MEELTELTGTQISVLAEEVLQRGKHEETLRRV